ncbi:MAG: hypothetical protein JOZ56_06310 [Actinobacteria bacterium]|nr:hypothetical protein [Actinomycetota bacterium]MBV8562686.1 hypothetical protein [Actinomycetota bacterium]
MPAGGAVAASPAVRLAIVHAVQGCHVWGTADSQPLGPTHTLALRRGTALQIRVDCPMDFTFSQLAGPPLELGDPVTHTGTIRTIVFAKPGLYKLQAVNVQSSAQQGLQTLGADNVLVLSVRVR